MKTYKEILNERLGKGTGREFDDGEDTCKCPKCGFETEHKAGTPCLETKCPKCGTAMKGKSKVND